MSIHSLHKDIWVFHIAPFLDVGSYLSLRLVDREFHEVFTSDEIWGPLVSQRWLQYRDHEESTIVDSFMYYVKCRQIDTKFTDLVLRSDITEIIKMINEYGDQLIPCLLRIQESDDLKYFSARYRAHEILLFLKYCPIYDMFNDIATNGVEYRPEDVILTLNRIQPDYYDLIKELRFMKQYVISSYQTIIFTGKYIDLVKYKKTTRCVMLIIELLYETIDNIPIKIEETSEAVMVPAFKSNLISEYTKMSVICSICHDLGIDIAIVDYCFLKVKDINFPNGYSYIFMAGRYSDIEVFNDKNLRGPCTSYTDYRHLRGAPVGNFINVVLDRYRTGLGYTGDLDFQEEDSYDNEACFLSDIYECLFHHPNSYPSRNFKERIRCGYPLHIIKLDPILKLGFKDEILTMLQSENTLKSIFFKNIRFYKDISVPKLLERLFDIGDIVSTGNVFILLGYKSQLVPYTDSHHIYYFLMNSDGNFQILDQENIRAVEPITRDLVLKFTDYKLGIFFESYDEEKKKFEWTKELKLVYNF